MHAPNTTWMVLRSRAASLAAPGLPDARRSPRPEVGRRAAGRASPSAPSSGAHHPRTRSARDEAARHRRPQEAAWSPNGGNAPTSKLGKSCRSSSSVATGRWWLASRTSRLGCRRVRGIVLDDLVRHSAPLKDAAHRTRAVGLSGRALVRDAQTSSSLLNAARAPRRRGRRVGSPRCPARRRRR
jgi:hypothetical protein